MPTHMFIIKKLRDIATIRCESHGLGSFALDARIQNLYFNISEMKLSIPSLYIISDTLKYNIIWTENSDVIDSFISDILEYKSLIFASWQKLSRGPSDSHPI